MKKIRREKVSGVRTRHHILPRSRGGNDAHSNIIVLEDKIHKAIHKLFSNLTPSEAIVKYIQVYCKDQKKWFVEAGTMLGYSTQRGYTEEETEEKKEIKLIQIENKGKGTITINF